MYNVKSPKAVEFIDDEEILATLNYAKENKNNRALIGGEIISLRLQHINV